MADREEESRGITGGLLFLTAMVIGAQIFSWPFPMLQKTKSQLAYLKSRMVKWNDLIVV
jgi:hypothetical protein